MAHSYSVRELPNATTLATIKNPGLNNMVVLVGVKVGSRYEAPGQYGAAHFLEHMMFKGTKRYPNSRVLSSVIDSRGGEHNAFIDRDRTNFYVRMASPFGEIAVDLVHEMFANSLFRNRDFNHERPVIQEEITGYENDPDQSAWMLSDARFYTDPGMNRPIAGSVKDVEFDSSVVRKFFKSYYVPSRTVVVLAGNFDKKIVDMAAKKFGFIEGTFSGTEYQETRTKVWHSFKPGNTDKMHLVFRFPGAAVWTPNARKLHILAMILGGYSSSRLFQTLREKKGLCYGIGSFIHDYRDVGSFFIGTTVDNNKFEATVMETLREISNLTKKGITKEELRSAKTCIQGQVISIMDRPMVLADNMAYQLNELRDFETPEDRLKRYMKITKDEIDEAARQFLDLAELSLTVVGPAASGSRVEKMFKQLRA